MYVNSKTAKSFSHDSDFDLPLVHGTCAVILGGSPCAATVIRASGLHRRGTPVIAVEPGRFATSLHVLPVSYTRIDVNCL